MAIDPSIPLQIRPVEIANPLDSATKALTMSNLMQEHQSNQIKLNQQQRDAADQQSLRDAYRNNTAVDDNGNPVTNRQGVLSDLAKANPMLAQQKALEFRKMDLDQLAQQHAEAKEIVFGINDQSTYEQAMQKMTQLGLPNMQHWPAQYDPDFVRRVQMGSLSAEEQLSQQNKQIDQAQKQQEINNKNKELQVQLGDKIDKASQALSNDLDPDKSRAGNFGAISAKVQSADRLKALIGAFKDKNLPAPQMEELALGMASMLAPGGGTSREQVDALVPKSAQGDRSKLSSWLNNDPKGANQQKFVEMMEGTIDRERSTAMGQLNQIRAGRLAAHGWLKKVAPDQFDAILRNKEMDPSKVAGGQYQAGKETSGSGSGEMVSVKLPDGRTGSIPRTNLEKAKSLGATLFEPENAATAAK